MKTKNNQTESTSILDLNQIDLNLSADHFESFSYGLNENNYNLDFLSIELKLNKIYRENKKRSYLINEISYYLKNNK